MATPQQPHRDLDVQTLPSMLLPRKGSFGLIDYEKAYAANRRAELDILRLAWASAGRAR